MKQMVMLLDVEGERLVEIGPETRRKLLRLMAQALVAVRKREVRQDKEKSELGGGPDDA